MGIEYREKPEKNAFKYPDDPEAVFPQYKPQKNIDFRSNFIPDAGYEFSGARRKAVKEPEVNLVEFEEFDKEIELKSQSEEEASMDDLEEEFTKKMNTGVTKKIKKKVGIEVESKPSEGK